MFSGMYIGVNLGPVLFADGSEVPAWVYDFTAGEPNGFNWGETYDKSRDLRATEIPYFLI